MDKNWILSPIQLVSLDIRGLSFSRRPFVFRLFSPQKDRLSPRDELDKALGEHGEVSQGMIQVQRKLNQVIT